MDLITVRGQKLLEEADIVVYAGSLVNPELLKNCQKDCQIYNSAKMTLEEVMEVMISGEKQEKKVVRLHTGDPCLYGAIKEQMDLLEKENISYKVCPGVSSFCGAASALNAEYTLPGISQSVVIPRMERDHHTHGRPYTGAGKRRDRFFCGTSGNDGNLFKYRDAGRTVEASDRRRLSAGDSGSDRLQGNLGG